ncbi:YybH family protein [Kitasatospora putterlickiae]
MAPATPPTDPARLPAVFAEAFNTGDPAAVEALFEPGAAFVDRPGTVLTGDDRRAAVARFLALGLPIRIELRHCYTSGDLALLIGDYLIEGEGPDGGPIRSEGTATDVARRGADGRWRYAIDNPPGTDRLPEEGPQ